MGWLLALTDMGKKSQMGGAPEEQGPGSGDVGYRDDGSNPFVDSSTESSPWNKIVGMSQAAPAGKAILTTRTGNEQLNPRAGAAGGRPEVVNPKSAAWDRYVGAYAPRGADGAGMPDPGDAQLFSMIWD